MTAKVTSVRLSLRPRALQPDDERLSATRVGDNRYRLLTSSFFAPLAVGDVVATDPDSGSGSGSGSEPVIVGIAEPGDMSLSVIRLDDDVPATRVASVTRSWCAAGASWSETRDGIVNTVWRAEVDADQVYDFLSGALRGRPDWHLVGVYGPQDRTRRALGAAALIA